MLVQMPLSPPPAIPKANTYTNAPLPIVETQEVDLTSHNLQNPPSLPHAPISSYSGVPITVAQGGFSKSSMAGNDNNVAYDGQLQPSDVAFLIFRFEGRGENCDDERIRIDSGSLFYHALLSN